MFHNKNISVPGNFSSLKDTDIERIDAGDKFEFAVDLLDLKEDTLKVMSTILDTFDIGSRSHSLTASGQCRLSALVPCTNDTTRLLDVLTKLMRYLHLALPWDTLSGHRARFRDLHSKLRVIYEKLTNMQYLRSVIQIPKLAEDISYFFETLHKMSERNEQPIEFAETFAEEPNDLVSIADESVDASMAYIQQEYSDLSSRYQMVLQMLEEEQQQRARLTQEAHLKEELDVMRKSQAEFAINNSETTSAAEADAKLVKLKTAYQKLRGDHIGLLRQKGDSEKNAAEMTLNVERLNAASKVFKELTEEFMQRHGIELADADNEESLRLAFQKLGEKISSLQVSLMSKDNTISSLENEKAISGQESANVLQLKEELESLRVTTGSVENRFAEVTSERDALMAKANATDLLVESTKADYVSLQTAFNAILKQLREHNVTKANKLQTFLTNEKAMSGGVPSLPSVNNAVITVDSFQSSNASNKAMAADNLIFHVMSVLVHLMPYVNTDTVKMARLYEIGSDLIAKVESDSDDIENEWGQFCAEAGAQLRSLDSSNFDPSESVDREIRDMQDSISNAAATMEKMMLAARANEAKKPNIEVDIKILHSCATLLSVIQVLIQDARHLQEEITNESGTFAKEFYRKNQKWSEGLISAAKDIGGGAKCLVDAADSVVSRSGKFEQVMVASQEIAGSTAQMVLASKVKAKQGSQKLVALSSSSKSVGEATAQVIATCRACASQLAESEQEVDLSQLSVHQSKRLEMEVQIKVLELETMLEKQRQKLFAIRKLQYARSNVTSKAGEATY